MGTNSLLSIALPTYAVSFKDFTLLDFHTNNISAIRADHTSVLSEMGSNITLILSRNPIAFIETGAFKGLHLEELDLRDTFSSSTMVRDATGGLNGLNVKRLRIGCYRESGRIHIYTDSLDNLCYINFQEIYLHQSTSSKLPGHIMATK